MEGRMISLQSRQDMRLDIYLTRAALAADATMRHVTYRDTL